MKPSTISCPESPPPLAHLRRGLSVIILALAALALLVPPLTAQSVPPGTPIFQEIMEFGTPSTGGYPRAGLIVGQDGAYYGTTSENRGNSSIQNSSKHGALLRVAPDGSEVTILYRFERPVSGYFPSGRLYQALDGTLYGACLSGGTHDRGTLFRIQPDGSNFAVIHHFGGSPVTLGVAPTGGLVEGIDGALYGTTRSGGHAAPVGGFNGILFRINKDGSNFSVPHLFSSLSSTGPTIPGGELARGPDGTLYGVVTPEPFGQSGRVYKINPDGSNFEIILTFNPASGIGGFPRGELVFRPDGFLYGSTDKGIYKLNPANASLTSLFTFSDPVTGSQGQGPLTFGPDGRIYGVATRGGQFQTNNTFGGTIFRLNADGTGFTVLQHLDSFTTGNFPNGALVFGADGLLYGTTKVGGRTDGGGTIFRLNPDGGNFEIVKSLSLAADLTDTGGYPRGGVMQGTDGMLYGANWSGGNDGYGGTLYRLALNGGEFEVLHAFNPSTSGRFPTGCPIQGQDGFLYGTTLEGAGTGGSLYRISLNGSEFSSVHQWNGSNGAHPSGELVQGPDGVLYGTTVSGGGYNGTVFRILPNGTGHAILHGFEYSDSIGSPSAGVALGPDGMLYGIAPYANGDDFSPYFGGVFRLSTDGYTYSIVRPFEANDSAYYFQNDEMPKFIQGHDGAMYGSARRVFRLDTASANVTFLPSPGANDPAYSGVIQALDGRLYAATRQGGIHGRGSLVSMNIDGSDYTYLHHFETWEQKSRLILASDGNLYGTEMHAGFSGGGSVYRLIIGDMRINALSPRTVTGGSDPFTLTVEGFYFAEGAVVEWDGVPLATQFVDGFTLTAEAPATAETVDLSTVRVTVRHLDGIVSDPELFVVTAGNVAEADGALVEAGTSVSVSTAPTTEGSVGVSGTLSNTGGEPATLTVANYSSDPSGTVFSAGGGFTDVQITGADEEDTATVDFYYPSTMDAATEAALSLVAYDGTGWVTVRSDGNSAPVKNTTNNLDGTISGGRFTVVFSATSTPMITELSGTFFAMGTPYGFDGFLAPIGGADHVSGGSFADPLRTFKAGSTIPVKFRASEADSPVLTGVHILRVRKFSSQTTSDTPIDASPQGVASTGNQFELRGNEWHFNLDTKATRLTTGIWQLTATLADGSQHFVWIQIK